MVNPKQARSTQGKWVKMSFQLDIPGKYLALCANSAVFTLNHYFCLPPSLHSLMFVFVWEEYMTAVGCMKHIVLKIYTVTVYIPILMATHFQWHCIIFTFSWYHMGFSNSWVWGKSSKSILNNYMIQELLDYQIYDTQ